MLHVPVTQPTAASPQISAILPMFARYAGKGMRNRCTCCSFPCVAGEGAEGGRGRSCFLLSARTRLPPSGLPATFPRCAGEGKSGIDVFAVPPLRGGEGAERLAPYPAKPQAGKSFRKPCVSTREPGGRGPEFVHEPLQASIECDENLSQLPEPIRSKAHNVSHTCWSTRI